MASIFFQGEFRSDKITLSLSPLLFDIVADMFTKMIKLATVKNILPRICSEVVENGLMELQPFRMLMILYFLPNLNRIFSIFEEYFLLPGRSED